MNHFAFRDFAPKQNRPSGFFQSAEYDNLMDAVRQANQWVADHDVKVVNIETVVFPYFNELVATLEQAPSYDWYQFIRVWYEFDERIAEKVLEEEGP